MKRPLISAFISAKARTPAAPPVPPAPVNSLTLTDLERYAAAWLQDGRLRQHSAETYAIRRLVADKLLWWLRREGHVSCGAGELRGFFAYLGTPDTAGRWGTPGRTGAVRPRTVYTYHACLCTLFRWLVSEDALDQSPMDAVPRPIVRADQIQPFTDSQIRSLLEAARRTSHPRRDEAILLVLLDTGLRASELCGLRTENVDLVTKRCQVLGKGNKHRTVFFGRATARALRTYLRERERGSTEPVFLSDRGIDAGRALTRSGLQQLLERLEKSAGLEAVRCSPHTFRHTFAISFLRAGGNLLTLSQMMAHHSVAVTQRYVALAQADVENQHRQFSPVDRLRGK